MSVTSSTETVSIPFYYIVGYVVVSVCLLSAMTWMLINPPNATRSTLSEVVSQLDIEISKLEQVKSGVDEQNEAIADAKKELEGYNAEFETGIDKVDDCMDQRDACMEKLLPAYKDTTLGCGSGTSEKNGKCVAVDKTDQVVGVFWSVIGLDLLLGAFLMYSAR